MSGTSAIMSTMILLSFYARRLARIAFSAAVIVLAVMMAGSMPANAFFDPPVVRPANPVEGQPISFDVRVGVCDFIQAAGPTDGTTLVAGDYWRQVTVSGSTVIVVVRASFAPDPALCGFPTGTFRFSLGVLARGNYRLELYGQDIVNPSLRPLVGTANFSVGAQPVAVPMLGIAAMLALIALMVAVGAIRCDS